MKEPCRMCLSARLDPDLKDNNDYSSIGIGCTSSSKRRFMLSSGDCLPVRIEFEMYCEEDNLYHTFGVYFPKYCPNCGRELSEYIVDEYGRDFRRK